MYYRNGREARNGDPVIVKDYANNVQVGVLHDLNVGADSCNGYIQRPIGSPWAVTISECYHAEDAYAAIEPKISVSDDGGKHVIEPNTK